MKDKKVRVRFAPSPTGPLHIGGVRTALFNYLFAKKHKGDFILRIEDTDQKRFVKGAEEYILESLKWCGFEPDESPLHGGDFGPYRQSERKGSYAQHAMRLVEEGKAYYAFDTAEELEEMRNRLKAARVVSPQYNAITRMQMKNSLTLPEDEVKRRLDAGDDYVIRIKVPRKEEIRMHDLVRGWVVVQSSVMDDKVLLKSDGMPTYHLANVVDDKAMQITHVIRGEEWLPSLPLHVLLYRYLGWEDDTPEFAHLPLLLRPDGNGKLSKRDGDRLGFPVFPINWQHPETGETASGYREAGYLPDAFINFLALLGWNPGNNQELFSHDELVEIFSIERVNKAGTRFDIEKAKWFNQQYLRAKPGEDIALILIEELQKEGIEVSPEKAAVVAELLKERAVFLSDFLEKGKCFFVLPESYDEKVVKKKWKAEVVAGLKAFKSALEEYEGDFSGETAKEILNKSIESLELKPGKVMQPLRLAATGEGVGPDLTAVLGFFGADELARRIGVAIEKIGDPA